MLVMIRSFFIAASLLFAFQMDAQTWSYNYQKGDFGEDSYHFAGSTQAAKLTGASYIDYTLRVSVGRADDSYSKPYVVMGGDILESLAWTVDAVKWIFEVKGEYTTITTIPSRKTTACFFERDDSAKLIPLLEAATRVRIEALTASGNLFKKDFKLSGSTAAIARVKQ
jgi:hypothetical protein